MRKRPSDSLNSVDNALLLLHLLRDQGVVTVSQAAAALGVSVSTAHRILVTLVYRDFAAQDAQRRYLPGPALSLHPGAHAPVAALRERLMPVMRALSTELTETVTLSVRLDTRVRVIAAVEAPRMLRVADQEGTVLPARLASSGKAMLATLSDDEVIDLFTSAADNRLTPAEARRLIGELAGIRRAGFAVNHGEAEQGVSAIGVSVRDSTGLAVAGLAVAMPSARFQTVNVEGVVSRIRAALASLNGISSDPTDIGRGPA